MIRPMREEDLEDAVAVSASAFGRGEERDDRWRQRVAHCLGTDPSGAFVAERDGRIIGVAEALRRERLWVLSLLTVDPEAQTRGVGRALLDAALGYADGTDAQLIVSSDDPRALRLYGLAGFRLLPTFRAGGTVDRSALTGGLCDPVEATPEALDELGDISRAVRGAPHTTELPHALAHGWSIFRHRDRGFAVAGPDRGVWLLAARDEGAARRVLWSALAHVGGAERVVGWITHEQRWAIDVVLRAGLRLETYGAVCVRGRPGPLRPYLPSPPFG